MSQRLFRACVASAGLFMMAGGLTGCQTWIAGMTLPSGYYMQHRPQYFPPDPVFPLPRELATMQAQYEASPDNGNAGRLPAPVNVAQ